jgi:large subunit ribosomal protein L24
MISRKPRKQRDRLYNAPLHIKRKGIASHLAENLLLKYDRRSIPVVKGDTVKIMRGSYRGHEEKIAKVNVRDQTVEIEGVTITTAKGTKIAKSIHASTLLITKLNLTDKWRRQTLESGLSETAKKEIEQEAEEQIKEQEAEEKAAEEVRIAEEKRKEAEEKEAAAAEEVVEEEAKPESPPEEPAKPSPAAEKKEETPEPPKQGEEAKEPPKKKPAAKKPAKKTPEKEEEGEP